MAAVYFMAAILIICPRAVNSQDNLYEFTVKKYLMGTEFEITAVYSSIDPMKKAMYYALKEVERIQGVMSMQIDSSEISKINNSAGVSPVKVSYETYSLIERSVNYSKKYDGIFDITIGPVTVLWGFNGDKKVTEIPDSASVTDKLALVGYDKIVLNPLDTSVFLKMEGMLLDLGGIAKGYAVDRASEIMKENGIANFIMNGGGDMYVSGEKSPGKPWSIGIKHPRKDNEIAGVFNARNTAIGTSGDYERFVIIDGKRYHHIFDTKTGYPSLTSQSSTVIAETTEEAVVLSKYFFIRGYELIENSTNPAVIIDSNGTVHYSEKLKTEYNLQLNKP